MKPSYIHTMTAYTGRQSNRGHRQTLYSRWANEVFTYVIFPSTTASISMALVLMHWSYVFLALTHRFGLWNSHDPDLWHIFGSTNFTNGFLAHKLKSCQKKKKYCEVLLLEAGRGRGHEISRGRHYQHRRNTTTRLSALDRAVFDLPQILARLVHNMSRWQLYLGFGQLSWLVSFGH